MSKSDNFYSRETPYELKDGDFTAYIEHLHQISLNRQQAAAQMAGAVNDRLSTASINRNSARTNSSSKSASPHASARSSDSRSSTISNRSASTAGRSATRAEHRASIAGRSTASPNLASNQGYPGNAAARQTVFNRQQPRPQNKNQNQKSKTSPAELQIALKRTLKIRQLALAFMIVFGFLFYNEYDTLGYMPANGYTMIGLYLTILIASFTVFLGMALAIGSIRRQMRNQA